jgi:hypothetical protein
METTSNNYVMTVALIGALATLIAAVVGQYLNRRREVKLQELKFKLDRYMDFLSGFSEMGSSYKSYEAHRKLANSVNLMNLIASREVLEKVHDLLDYIGTHQGEDYSVEQQDNIIRSIILSIRKDLGQKVSQFKDFKFRTISPGIKPDEAIEK